MYSILHPAQLFHNSQLTPCSTTCLPVVILRGCNCRQTKACWRWCRDRSLVISRWTWLQAQVSDLEYKIRQHGTLHANLRKAKSQILSPTGPSISTTTDDSTYRAARCMPLSAPVTKPRHKTMRISDAPSMGSKGRKPVMVRCQCIQAIRRCAICAGHHNYFKPMDIHSLPVNERISQVDKGFHPVLSFPRGNFSTLVFFPFTMITLLCEMICRPVSLHLVMLSETVRRR